MAKTGGGNEGADDAALLALFRAIASRDEAEIARLLDSSPGLPSRPIRTAASRTDAEKYFLVPIRHYIYGGDTALHIAAAAAHLQLAESLVANGADPRARNRRGAEPLHYAADSSPGADYWDPVAQCEVIAFLDRGRSGSRRARQQRCGAAASSRTHSWLGRGRHAHRARRRCPADEQAWLDAVAPRGAEHRSEQLRFGRGQGAAASGHRRAPPARSEPDRRRCERQDRRRRGLERLDPRSPRRDLNPAACGADQRGRSTNRTRFENSSSSG